MCGCPGGWLLEELGLSSPALGFSLGLRGWQWGGPGAALSYPVWGKHWLYTEALQDLARER